MVNVSVFSNSDNATAFSNLSRCIVLVCSEPVHRMSYVILYVVIAVGIPGNLLSAIVWFRRRVENSSAIYLATLAVNDLLHIPIAFVIDRIVYDQRGWLWHSALYGFQSTATVETLMVLGFSVERFIALSRPLQVCRFCIMAFRQNFAISLM